MSARGHRAVLPPADHRTDPPLAPDNLTVTVVNKAGHPKTFNFAALPVAEPMQRALAAAFAAQSRHWTSHETGVGYWRKLLTFARFLSVLEHPPQDLNELTPAMLKRWRAHHVATNTGRATLSQVRTVLQQDQRLRNRPAAEELARRIPKPRHQQQSYEPAQWKQIRLTAQRQFRAAWLRIRQNNDLLEAWRSGQLSAESRDGRIGQILEHVARTGDVPRTMLASGQERVTDYRLLGGHGPQHTWGRLLLTRRELTALAVLLTGRFGWNLSVYDRLPTPTSAPSVGETTTVTYQVQVEKRRASGGRWFSTENITDAGVDSAGRLITQALQATAPGRELAARLAPGTDLLMTARSHWRRPVHRNLDRPSPVGPLVFGVSKDDGMSWAHSHQLGGSPFQRARRTTVTREGQPLQHSPGTHESVYLLPDRQVQRASQQVFADGADEALNLARSTVFHGRLGTVADPEHRQTATADCADEATSPWPAPHGGCAADYLLCLACRNAHVHPGHHPRLAHLHQRLQALRSALPDSAFNARWREPLLRLEDLRDKVGPAAWNAARARISDADRTLTDLLLKGDLAP